VNYPGLISVPSKAWIEEKRRERGVEGMQGKKQKDKICWQCWSFLVMLFLTVMAFVLDVNFWWFAFFFTGIVLTLDDCLKGGD